MADTALASEAAAGSGLAAFLGPAAFLGVAGLALSGILGKNEIQTTSGEALAKSPINAHAGMTDKMLWEAANIDAYRNYLQQEMEPWTFPSAQELSAIRSKYGSRFENLVEPTYQAFMSKWGKVSNDPAVQNAWWGYSEEGSD